MAGGLILPVDEEATDREGGRSMLKVTPFPCSPARLQVFVPATVPSGPPFLSLSARGTYWL